MDFQRKHVALGSDGANVMVGNYSGVARRLQSDAPHLVSSHCVAHRLALASAQVANDIRCLNEFKDVLQQLFRFYHNSGVRMSGLKAIQVFSARLMFPSRKSKMSDGCHTTPQFQLYGCHTAQ